MTDRYERSPMTGQWYRVDVREDLGDGKIRAVSKTPVDRDEVPEEWLEAVDDD